MYRLVRRFRARVKAQEIVLLCIVLAFAFAFGSGAGAWYQGSGRYHWLISSVNNIGGIAGESPVSDYDTVGNEERNAYDFFATVSADATSGFFTSPRASLLQPANVYSASLLTLPGPDGADTGAAAEQRDASEGDSYAPNTDEPISSAERHAEYLPEISHETMDAGELPVDNLPPQPVYTVKVIYYGDRHVIQTTSKKVFELFEEHGITVGDNDKMTGAFLDGTIDSDLYIEIKRVTTKTIVEDVKIKAKIAYRDNPDLSGGQSKVVRNAVDGLKRVEYLITYENGIQVSKNAIKEEVISEAVSGIVEQGATGKRKGKDGVEFSYSKVIDVKCTAYNSGFESTGKTPSDPDYGITKTGMQAREGVVAVDPSVIPLYTKMYIEILDEGIEDYGFAVAGDTGGKIKGKKVDLYFDAPQAELLKFGVRKARVYILD